MNRWSPRRTPELEEPPRASGLSGMRAMAGESSHPRRQ